MSVGDFVDTNGVTVGQAVGLYAPEYTPLPPDTFEAFDLANWVAADISLSGATGGTFKLRVAGVATSALAFGATLDQISTAVATVVAQVLGLNLNTALTCVSVTGLGTTLAPYRVALKRQALDLNSTVTFDGALLTGTTGDGPSETPSLWTPGGGTEQGWQVNYAMNTQDIRIEEQPSQVDVTLDNTSMTFVANLAQDTFRSLKLAMNASQSVQAAGAGVFGKRRLRLGSELIRVAAAVETVASKGGPPRRFYIPSATVAGNVGITFRRAAAMRMVPVTFTSVCPTEDIVIEEITDEPTS